MNVFSRTALAIRKSIGMLSPVAGRGGWFSIISEPFGGAWQRNCEISVDTALSNTTLFSCVTLIAGDIGKLRMKLMEYDDDGIGTETTSPAFTPVLRKPNRFQNHIQFKEWWITSKLCRGNAYALKQMDNRGVVVALYLLDPARVEVLVAPDGSIFYKVGEDNLSGTKAVIIPASEIIHDRMNCLFHPLVGISPIFACGMPADQGLKIQDNAARFFANSSMPSGILIAPGPISDEWAEKAKAQWESKYSGENAGKVAVLGDGLKFEPMRMTAVDSQMMELWGMTAAQVCSAFHIPGFMVGVGPEPLNNNVESLGQQYYTRCLQTLIENFEQCMNEGVGLDEPKNGVQMWMELDLDGLLRMDTATQMATLKVGVDGGIFAPNEARKKVNLRPLTGGDTVYLQQQQYSIEALSERDADKPFAKPPVGAPAVPAVPANPDAGKDVALAAINALADRDLETSIANAQGLEKVMAGLAALDARIAKAETKADPEVDVAGEFADRLLLKIAELGDV